MKLQDPQVVFDPAIVYDYDYQYDYDYNDWEWEGDMIVLPEGKTELSLGEQQRFWLEAAATKEEIAKLIPDRDAWELTLVRDSFGTWSFSLPEYKTHNEALVGGTEKAIDWHFEKTVGRKPKGGDQLVAYITNGDRVTPEEYDTYLQFVRACEGIGDSNYYVDVQSLQVCWLCPYLQALFKGVPQYLFIKWTAVAGPVAAEPQPEIERPFWWDSSYTGTITPQPCEALTYNEWVEWEERMDRLEAGDG